MDVTIRKIQKQEYPLLDHFLYEAIFVPEGIDPPPKTIITSPELQVYVKHFGESKDDWGLVSEVDSKQISLSVQKSNYAAKMYLKTGFEIVRENAEEYIMVNYL